jgi:hypothetical protein
MELQKLADGQSPSAGQSLFEVMGREGDSKYIWDKNNAIEVEIARNMFNAFRDKGYLAFKVTNQDGSKGEQTREFDANAERYIFSPPMQGG